MRECLVGCRVPLTSSRWRPVGVSLGDARRWGNALLLRFARLAMVCIGLSMARSVMAADAIPFAIEETAGWRRYGYPVTVSLQCPKGKLRDAAQTRLFNGDGKEVAAQFTGMSTWPDGSVRGLDVDFAPSPGPMERLSFRVEIGEPPKGTPRGGLRLVETADEWVVESDAIRHRIRRDGKPLLTSIAFGKTEFIAPGGVKTTIEPGPVEVFKRGPFNVTIGMGDLRLSYVSTKSWVELTQRSTTNRELVVDAHFVLSDKPLLWDFGLGSWMYGTLAGDGDRVSLLRAAGAWQVQAFDGSVLAVAPTFDGCGHFADAQRAVAFGVIRPGDDTRIDLHPDGRLRLASRGSELTAYFHFVGQPIPVTAATSPQAMVSPLKVIIP